MNLIHSAAIRATAENAMDALCLALNIEPTDRHADLPGSTEWNRASDPQRMIWIGEWLRTLAYNEAAAAETAPLVAWTPTGGDKYAHQND